MTCEEQGTSQPSFEVLLDTYPDISVMRDRTGLVTISKTLSPNSATHVTIDVDTDEQGQNPVLFILAEPYVRGQEMQLRNTRSFVKIIRDPGQNLTAEVDYPDDSLSRVELEDMLAIARQGLELFDAYSRATPGEQTEGINRVYDMMGGGGRRLKEDVEKMNPQLAEIFNRVGFDLTTTEGHAKYALMTLREIKQNPNFVVKNVGPNAV